MHVRALLLTCLACSPEREWLPLPPAENARTVVVGTGTNDQVTEAIAFDANAPPARIAVAAEDPDVGIWSGLFAEPASELPFQLGPLATDPSGASLPTALEVLRADRASSTWMPAMIDPFTNVKIPRQTSCHTLVQGAPTELGRGDNDVDLGAKLEDGSVFLVTTFAERRAAYRFMEPGRADPVSTGERPLHSVAETNDGMLWLGGTATVYAARLIGPGLHEVAEQNQLEIVAAHPFTPSPNFTRDFVFALLVRTDPLEIFALTGMGHFSRFDGTTWTTLHDFAWQAPLWASGGLVDLGDEGVIAAWSGSSQMVRYDDGDLSREGPPDLMDGFTAAGYVPNLGAIAGTSKGELYVRRSANHWESLGESGLTLNVLMIAPFEKGFLAGAALGALVEWTPTDGFCQTMSSDVAGVKVIVPLDDHHLLISGQISGIDDSIPPRVVIVSY